VVEQGITRHSLEMFPNHPNLLPAYLDGPRNMSEYVRKPLVSREGANILVKTSRGEFETQGPYSGPWVYQQLASAAVIDGQTP
jgi:glutathionylspermidine synthase